MQDRPDATELLAAMKVFLETDVLPNLKGRARFHALVSANVCGIVGREIELAPAQREAEIERLCLLLGIADDGAAGSDRAAFVRYLNEQLVDCIEAGAADQGEWRAEVFTHLRETVREKLAIDNPSMLA
ncbi:MAG: hypothetical protein ACI8TX_002692 [Hyphomicrobiaceae bacterium]|jgi:hypothetical protein